MPPGGLQSFTVGVVCNKEGTYTELCTFVEDEDKIYSDTFGNTQQLQKKRKEVKVNAALLYKLAHQIKRQATHCCHKLMHDTAVR